MSAKRKYPTVVKVTASPKPNPSLRGDADTKGWGRKPGFEPARELAEKNPVVTR